jgi:regulator of sigma E protease
MHEFLVSLIAFIVLVGVMVVVHEFGHFVVAKLCGVRVEAFAFGFGPRLFGYKYGDTDYKVCLLPLGGFVKMAGENFAELSDAATGTATVAPVSDPGALTSHPRWQQMLISAAGPVANFILAFVLMVGYYGWINEVPAVNPIHVEWVSEGSSAAQAGIEPGDILRRFDKFDNPTWEQIRISAIQNVNQTVPITVERTGKSLSLSLRMAGNGTKKRFDVSQAGLFLQYTQSPIQVDSVISNAPAAQAGLQSEDLILAVDGHAFHTLDPMVDYLQTGRGKPITLTVSRNGHTIAPLVAHPTIQDSSWRLGFTYVPPTDIPVHQEPLSFSQSIAESKDFCVDNSTLILDMLGRIFSHKVSVSQLSGPVGIARVAGDAAEAKGWSYKFWLAAAISINLGIINLLPFPILDGGSILFLLIESVLRREISINVKERIYQAAFVALILLFVLITFNDVARIPFFTHMKP